MLCSIMDMSCLLMQGVGDTIDVVPIGGFHGKGKRTGEFDAMIVVSFDLSPHWYGSPHL